MGLPPSFTASPRCLASARRRSCAMIFRYGLAPPFVASSSPSASSTISLLLGSPSASNCTKRVQGKGVCSVSGGGGGAGGQPYKGGHVPIRVLDATAKEWKGGQWVRAGLSPALARPLPLCVSRRDVTEGPGPRVHIGSSTLANAPPTSLRPPKGRAGASTTQPMPSRFLPGTAVRPLQARVVS